MTLIPGINFPTNREEPVCNLNVVSEMAPRDTVVGNARLSLNKPTLLVFSRSCRLL